MEEQTTRRSAQRSFLHAKFLTPLSDLVQKFSLLQSLVEHVVDMSRLPDLVVAAQHCPVLLELQTDMRALEQEAGQVRDQTVTGLQRAGVEIQAEIKLESSAQLGFFLRSARGDDERQLRQGGGGKVEVLSLQKVRMPVIGLLTD